MLKWLIGALIGANTIKLFIGQVVAWRLTEDDDEDADDRETPGDGEDDA